MTAPAPHDTRYGLLVDGAAAVTLIALTMSLLDESYWSRGYLVAGLLPVVFLLAFALVLRRVTDGSSWYALVALVSYAPLGALVALQKPGPWFFPTAETMSRVLGETISAPQLFVNTLPPVEASGTLMLIPFALGYLAGAPAVWFAVATRAPVLPLVPIIAGLAATIPLAVLVPEFLIMRGLLFGVLCVAWAADRSRRREALVGRRRGAIAGAVLSTMVVASVSTLVTLLVPDNIEVDRALLPAGDDSARMVELASDNVVPPGAGKQVLLKVDGMPVATRLRFAALDVYTDSAWTAAQGSSDPGVTGTFRRIAGTITPLHQGDEVKVRIRIRPDYVSDWLPTVGELTSLDLDYRDGRTQLRDVRYNQQTSSALVVGGVNPRDDYTFISVLTPDTFRPSDETQVPTEMQRQPEGKFLDKYLTPFQRSEGEPLKQVLLLAKYLRQNGAARLSGSSSQEAIDLGARLLGSDRISATPFQYSAVMALGASRLGVPARVVVGAEPASDGTVTHNDVVSWVELQFADGTWRTLDPTRYVGVHASAEDEDIEIDVGSWVSDEEQAERDKNIKIPKGADIDLPEGTVIEEPTNPWQVLGLAIAAVAGLVALVWLCVPLMKLVRRRARRRTKSWSSPYVNGWQEVLDAARDRGTPIPDSWSRVAQAEQLGVGVDLARVADATVFSPVAASAADGREFWDRTQGLRRQLLADSSGRERVWALFNPGSLLAGWQRRKSAKLARSGVRPVRDEDRRAGRQQPAGT